MRSYSKAKKLTKSSSSSSFYAATTARLESVARSDARMFHQYFEEMVARYPEHWALEDEVFGNRTYKELSEEANRLARCFKNRWPPITPLRTTRLQAQTRVIHPHEVVLGLYMPLSTPYVVCVLACQKAGIGYMPITTHLKGSSLQQLALQIKHMPIKAIITLDDHLNDDLLSTAAIESKPILSYENLQQQVQREAETHLGERVSPQQIAHVLATSGTTGDPKIVVTELEGFGALVASCISLYAQHGIALTPTDRVLGFAGIGFDAHFFDLCTLATGACLCIVPQASRLNTKDKLPLFFKNHRITHAVLVRKVITELDCSSDMFSTLRFLMWQGDHVAANEINAWLENKPDVSLVAGNGLGWTECFVASSIRLFHEKLPSNAHVSVGTALAHQEFIVVKPQDHTAENPVLRVITKQDDEWQDTNTAGELYVVGIGIARGYYISADQDQATRKSLEALNQRFDEVTFRYPNGVTRTLRAFQTGEQVRWNKDGELEVLGRVKRQIKINGILIHPEQIEGLIETEYTKCIHHLNYNLHRSLGAVHVEKHQSIDGHAEWLRVYLVIDSSVNFIKSLDRLDLAKIINDRLGLVKVPKEWVFVKNNSSLWHGKSQKLNRQAILIAAKKQACGIYYNQPQPLTVISANQGCEVIHSQSSSNTAPKDSVETCLAELWRANLPWSSDRVLYDDDFIFMGGDSLRIGELCFSINREFNLHGNEKLVPDDIFRCRTFGSLMRYLKRLMNVGDHRYPTLNEAILLYPINNRKRRQSSHTIDTTSDSRIKRRRKWSIDHQNDLQAQGRWFEEQSVVIDLRVSPREEHQSASDLIRLKKPTTTDSFDCETIPVFLIHSLLGDVVADATQITRFWKSSKRRLYGISARGLVSPKDQDNHIEVIAKDYLVSIMAIQSTGPYLLVGWSAGGPIIYAMARLLAKTGYQVSVVMIDSEGPRVYQEPHLFSEMLIRGFQGVIAKRFGLRGDSIGVNDLCYLPGELQVKKFIAHLSQSPKTNKEKERFLIENILRAMLTQSQRLSADARKHVRTHLWCATQTLSNYSSFELGQTLGWRADCLTAIRKLVGNHFDIMLDEAKGCTRAKELVTWADREMSYHLASEFKQALKAHYRAQFKSISDLQLAAFKTQWCQWISAKKTPRRIDIVDTRPFASFSLSELLCLAWANDELSLDDAQLVFHISLSHLPYWHDFKTMTLKKIMKTVYQSIIRREWGENSEEETNFYYIFTYLRDKMLLIIEEDDLPLTIDSTVLAEQLRELFKITQIHFCCCIRDPKNSRWQSGCFSESEKSVIEYSCAITKRDFNLKNPPRLPIPTLPDVYIPRIHYIHKMSKRLIKQKSSLKGLILVGIHGSGKTELIKQFLQYYACEVRPLALNVIWLDARSSDTIEDSIQQLRLPNEQMFSSEIRSHYVASIDFLVAVATAYRNSVVVFDDIESKARTVNTVQPYLERLKNYDCVILLSAQRKEIHLEPVFPTLDLSRGLIYSNVAIYMQKITGLVADDFLEQLIKYLDCLPLSINVAAHFIRHMNHLCKKANEPSRYTCFGDYFNELREFNNLLAEEQEVFWHETSSSFKYNVTQDHVIGLSIRSLCQAEQVVLWFCSMLDSRHLPEILLKSYYTCLKNQFSNWPDVVSVFTNLKQSCLLLESRGHGESLTGQLSLRMHECTRRVLQLHLSEKYKRDELDYRLFESMQQTLVKFMTSEIMSSWSLTAQHQFIDHIRSFRVVRDHFEMPLSQSTNSLTKAEGDFRESVARSLIDSYHNGKVALKLIEDSTSKATSSTMLFLKKRATSIIDKKEANFKLLYNAFFTDKGLNLGCLVGQDDFFPKRIRFYWELYGTKKTLEQCEQLVRNNSNELKLLPIVCTLAATLKEYDKVWKYAINCIDNKLLGDIPRMFTLYLSCYLANELNLLDKRLTFLKALLSLTTKDFTPLMFASMSGHVEMVKLFLQSKVDINAKTREGNTALMTAVKFRHADIVDLLLQEDAKPDLQDCEGGSALLFACWNYHKKVVKLLLEAGANIDLQDTQGRTVLNQLCMVEQPDINIIEFLLVKEARVDKPDSNGNTPLLNACKHQRHRALIRLLITYHSDVRWKNKEQKTAYDLADQQQHHKIVRLLNTYVNNGDILPSLSCEASLDPIPPLLDLSEHELPSLLQRAQTVSVFQTLPQRRQPQRVKSQVFQPSRTQPT